MPKLSICVIFFLAILIVAVTMTLVAFLPTYQAGVDGVDDTIGNLRTNIVGKLESEISSTFRRPLEVMNTLSITESRGTGKFAANDIPSKLDLACEYALSLRGVATNFFYNADDHPQAYRILCDITSRINQGYTNASGYLRLYMFNETSMRGTGVETFASPGLPLTVAKTFSQFRGLTNYYKPTWGIAVEGYSSLKYELGMKTTDDLGNNAEIIVSILPNPLVDLMLTLGLRSRTRAFLADARTGTMLATSWNESTVIPLAGYKNLRVPPKDRMILKNVTDFADEAVNDAIFHVGGQAGFLSVASPYSSEFNGPDGKTFVDVVEFSDSAGMRLRVMLVLPQKDYTEQIEKTRNETIGGVCGALVFMLVASVVFSVLLARPLQALSQRMYLTASLQDSGEDDPPSLMAEVANMQEAYATMRSELNRMKAYLPQSLLQKDNSSDEDEDEEGSHAGSSRSRSQSRGDRSSQNSSTTRQSGGTVARAGLAAGGLRMAKTVTPKRCAVICFNLVGFHSRCITSASALSPGEVSKLQKEYLEVVIKHIRENKGVVDVFQGDRVVASFGAVTNVACAAKRAAITASAIATELAKDPRMPSLAVGIATGQAIVGNMGTDDMQRFNIVGMPYTRSQSLVRIATEQLLDAQDYASHNNSSARKATSRILVCPSSTSEISLEYLVQAVGASKIERYGKTVVLRALDKAKSMASEEWMYQLEEGEKGDPFAKVNEAFEAYVGDNVEKAAELMETLPDTLEGVRALRKLLSHKE